MVEMREIAAGMPSEMGMRTIGSADTSALLVLPAVRHDPAEARCLYWGAAAFSS